MYGLSPYNVLLVGMNTKLVLVGFVMFKRTQSRPQPWSQDRSMFRSHSHKSVAVRSESKQAMFKQAELELKKALQAL